MLGGAGSWLFFLFVLLFGNKLGFNPNMRSGASSVQSGHIN